MTMHEPATRSAERVTGSAGLVSRERPETGASAVEYGLLIAGIAALIAIAVFAFGGGATGLFNNSCSRILQDSHIGGTCSG